MLVLKSSPLLSEVDSLDLLAFRPVVFFGDDPLPTDTAAVLGEIAWWSARVPETLDNFVLFEFLLAGGVSKLMYVSASVPESFMCEGCVVCEGGEEATAVETSCDELCSSVS